MSGTGGTAGRGGASAGERGGGTSPGTPDQPGRRSITLTRDMLWPLAVVVFLATVVLVNVVFIYVAVQGADEVAPSYVTGDR